VCGCYHKLFAKTKGMARCVCLEFAKIRGPGKLLANERVAMHGISRCCSYLGHQPGVSAVCKHPPHVLSCGSSLERDFDTFVDHPCATSTFSHSAFIRHPGVVVPPRRSEDLPSKSIVNDRLTVLLA